MLFQLYSIGQGFLFIDKTVVFLLSLCSFLQLTFNNTLIASADTVMYLGIYIDSPESPNQNKKDCFFTSFKTYLDGLTKLLLSYKNTNIQDQNKIYPGLPPEIELQGSKKKGLSIPKESNPKKKKNLCQQVSNLTLHIAMKYPPTYIKDLESFSNYKHFRKSQSPTHTHTHK